MSEELIAPNPEPSLEEKIDYIFNTIKKAEQEFLPAVQSLASGPLGGMLGGLFR